MKKIFGGNLKFLLFFGLFYSMNLNCSSIHLTNACEFSNCLKNIKENNTVILQSGIYIGNYIIDKSIKLIASGLVIFTSNANGSIVTITANNVKIDGIYFYNSGKSMIHKDSCVFINSNNVYILNNFFSECGFGIWINSSSYSYILNNTFIGTTEPMLSDNGNTINIYKSNGTIITNNFIINGRDGIYISNSIEISINKNFLLNTRFGIHYMFSNRCIVASNMISDSLIGIAVMYSKYVDLVNNFSYLNIDHGLFFRDVLYSRILRNKSLYNNDGILLGNSYFNDIINNDIIKNNIGIKIYSGGTDNLVYDNNVISNRLQSQYLDNNKLIWNSSKTGNFWSHYLGWDLNMDNIGDQLFYVTNINDWLIFSYPILKIMLNSPVLILLQKIENQFPAFRKYSIVDKFPLMRAMIW
ncbi:MAG TPA: nitrous oxide reductase family maturation protein NosD [Candidatus Azoamicus sp. OHIO2]